MLSFVPISDKFELRRTIALANSPIFSLKRLSFMAEFEVKFKSNFQISRIKSLMILLSKPNTGWFKLRTVFSV